MTDRHCPDCGYDWSSDREPQTRLYYGTDLWDEIGPVADSAGPRRAAIAFLGNAAPELLGMFVMRDRLIVNAGPRAITSGATSVEALATLFERGVQLASHDRLHAKVIVTRDWAVIGSSNASTASNRSEEAVVITNVEPMVSDARTMVKDLWAQAEEIDAGFIARARTLVVNEPPVTVGVPGVIGVEPFPPRNGYVYFAESELAELPEEVDEVLQTDQAAARRALGGTPGRTLESWWDAGRSAAGKGDVLIRVTEEDDDYYLEHPSLIVSKTKVPGRGNGWAYTLQSLRDRDGIWLSEHAEAFASVELDATNLHDGVLDDPAAIDHILDLWVE